MKRVIIESPFAANEYVSQEQHRAYLLHCIRDCVERGEAPFASHLLLPEVLNDDDVLERATGIKAGFTWGQHADVVAVYSDLGVSPGMKDAIAYYKQIEKPIDWRSIDHRTVSAILDG